MAPSNANLSRPALDLNGRPGRKILSPDIWRPWRPTIVTIGSVAIGLTLYELSEEAEVQSVNGKYMRVDSGATKLGSRSKSFWAVTKDMPSGRFGIRAYSPYLDTSWQKQWTESKIGELPKKIRRIRRELEGAVHTIAILAHEAQERKEKERLRWEEERAAWELREMERRRQQAYRDSRDQLLSLIDEWALARRIDEFLVSVSNGIDAHGPPERAELEVKLEKARQMLTSRDALQHFELWKPPEQR